MPARKKIFHDEDTRKRIKAGVIMERLTRLIAGEIEMPPHAVTAALGLLRKVLPDLAQIEHSGELTTTKVVRLPSVNKDTGQWQKEHTPEQFKTIN